VLITFRKSSSRLSIKAKNQIEHGNENASPSNPTNGSTCWTKKPNNRCQQKSPTWLQVLHTTQPCINPFFCVTPNILTMSQRLISRLANEIHLRNYLLLTNIFSHTDFEDWTDHILKRHDYLLTIPCHVGMH